MKDKLTIWAQIAHMKKNISFENCSEAKAIHTESNSKLLTEAHSKHVTESNSKLLDTNIALVAINNW